MTHLRSGLIGALTLAALSALYWPTADAAEPVLPNQIVAADVDGEPLHSGVFACLGCHSAGEQTPYVESLALVRMDEVRIWLEQDKHSLAFCVLSGELGRQMSERLGYNVSAAKECLACHAPRHEQRSAAADAPPNYKLSEGVSCEDCHGGSRGWHRLHVLKDQWRELSPKQKQSHGMNDLRDPLTRANVCLDCHVGNAEQGQIVTHAMYAAGHPPLASIDIVAYANDMPRHWRTPTEQAERGAAQVDSDPLSDARMAIAGLLVAGERSLRLAARPYEALPDFANFDCDACHHELSSPSWRQARLTQGMPGRPMLREWPLQMATLTSQLVADNASAQQARTKLDELRAIMQSRPFGGDSKTDTVTSVALADAWSQQASVFASAHKQPLDSQRWADAILERALDSQHPPDYDTARTLAWLLKYTVTASNDQQTATAKAAWSELDRQLNLSIPHSAIASVAEVCDLGGEDAANGPALQRTQPATPRPATIAHSLPQSLRARANYDPAKFQQAMQKFAESAQSR
jgi:hypothetical protein